jgi:hypothetical protein
MTAEKNDDSNDDMNRKVALTIVERATPAELQAVYQWAQGMLELREKPLSIFNKAKQAISLTLSSKITWPVVKNIAYKMKEVGWDNRSRTSRLGLIGATAGIVLFGGQSAGIAALGTAIGVPLWIVLGAGASFANLLIEEIARRRQQADDCTFSIIEAKRVDTEDH